MNDSSKWMQQQQEQEQEKMKRLCDRIKNIYENGYVASRNTNESYSKMIDGYAYACDFVNCYGHAVFNFTNKLLGNVVSFKLFSYFPGITHDSNSKAEERLMALPEQVGLKVTPWSVERSIEPNEWLVALYFDRNQSKDFHFLLQEAPNVWSSKLGYTGYVELICNSKLPEIYCSGFDKNNPYDLYGVYKITNKKAGSCRIRDDKLYAEYGSKKSQCIIQTPGKLYYPDNQEPIFDLEI